MVVWWFMVMGVSGVDEETVMMPGGWVDICLTCHGKLTGEIPFLTFPILIPHPSASGILHPPLIPDPLPL